MLQFRLPGLLLAASLVLAACGGGGGGSGDSATKTSRYTGSTEQAIVTDENARDLADASMAGAKNAIYEKNAQGMVFSLSQEPEWDPAKWLAQLSLDLLRQQPVASSSPALRAATEPQVMEGNCGGNATITDFDETATSSSLTIRYNNFCMEGDEPGDKVTINGTVHFTERETAGGEIVTLTYDNVSVTYGGETHYLNGKMTVNCSPGGYDCTYESTSAFVGDDDHTYQLTVNYIDGDDSSGYSIEARVYHPEHGYVEFIASNIIVCDNGNIGSGSIVVSDSSGEVMSITFNSCSNYTITRNGVGESYDY